MDFRLLGPVELRNGAHAVELGPQQARCLLAILLLEAGLPVSVDRLAERIWDGEPPDSARATLHKYVAALRRTIGSLGEEAGLERRPGGYVLRVDPDRVDVHRFTAMSEQAHVATQERQHARAVDLLDRALAQWHGVALADLTGGWAERVRRRFDEDRMRAVIGRIEAKLALGRHAEVVGELSALVAEHPFNETVVGQLMQALYRDGRATDATECYRAAYQRFIDEVGKEPGEDLRDLHQRILRDDPDLAALPAPTVVVPAEPVPATLPPSRPRQLPADVTRFTGRGGYLSELDALLPHHNGGNRATVVISAIAGTAGVGKTALAVHWAHSVADQFPDGQLYVDLRGHSPGLAPLEPAESLARLLRALGVPPAHIPTEEDELAGVYRDRLAGKRVLVLLDNAADTTQVRPLLPGSPTCLAVITSRSRLDELAVLHDVHRLVVDVLTNEEAVTLVAKVLGADRIAAEPEAARELAQLCARLPLALRIALAYLDNRPDYTLARYVERLRRGDRLAGVSAAFDLSYAVLPGEARRLFRRLGLTPGSRFTTDAAAHLADVPTDTAEHLLDTLAEAHLVEPFGPDQYRFHDLLRLYAGRLAEREDGAPNSSGAVRRLLDFYVHTADAAVRLVRPTYVRLPRDPPAPRVRPLTFDTADAALGWLDAERPTLVAAVGYAADHGYPAAAWHLADALRSYFTCRRSTADWIATGRAGFTAAIHQRDLPAQAAMHRTLAQAHWSLSDHRQMRSHLIRALAINTKAEDVDGEASILVHLGILYRELGQLTQAAEHTSRALAVLDGAGRHPFPIVYGNLAFTYQLMGQLDRATDAVTRALTLHRYHNDRTGYAEALDAYGRICRDRGRYQDALSYLESALAMAGRLGDRERGQILHSLGTVHECLADHDEALSRYQHSFDLAGQMNDEYTKAEALTGFASTRARLGEYTEALDWADQSLAVSRSNGYALCEARVLTVLARIHRALALPERAEQFAGQALTILTQSGAPVPAELN